MLNNIYEFQKIHLHTQRIMYFLPLVFIYFFLLPNHYQLLVNADESILIKIFDSAQEFLILIEIWFQYLGFRWILSPELKEISYCNMRIKKNMWFSSNTILSVVLFLPYAIILALISEKYFFNVWAAFKDNYGIDLDTSDFGDAVHPMELVNSSKTYTIYKK